MRSATVLILVSLLVLALVSKSGRNPRAAAEQPQTPPSPPPAQTQPAEEKPSVTEDYEEAMKETERKVVLVFGAKWCPHCVLLKDHLKNMNLDGYLVCLIDVDSHKDLKRKYKPRGLPTSVLIEKGEEVSREVGFEKARYEAWFEENRK